MGVALGSQGLHLLVSYFLKKCSDPELTPN